MFEALMEEKDMIPPKYEVKGNEIIRIVVMSGSTL